MTYNVEMKFRWFIIIFLVLADLLVWNAVSAHGDSLLKVSFLDVGQGDAVLIEAPNGNQMLVDGGQAGALMTPLAEVVPFYDRSIDVVLATHPDADHIGGLPELLRRFHVEAFIDPGQTTDKETQGELESEVTAEGARRFLGRRGLRVWLASDVVFEIHYPDRDVSKEESNDASIIGKLIYGETSFLLTGDAPTKTEEYLVGLDGARIDSDVLKVGHHGSKTSTSQNFLAAVTPTYAVISSGQSNRYGHPSNLVLQLLENDNIQVLRTDEEGTITFVSDGRTISRR
jgi:competence protein ComEC